MSSLPRYVMVLALSFVCAGFTSASTSQTNFQKKAPNGSVSGRVTIHGKGAPGIAVSMRNAGLPSQPVQALKATTDQDGNYRITEVPAGNYQVAPMSAAFVMS